MINNKKRESGNHFLNYRLNRMEILNYNSLINVSVENNKKYSNAFIIRDTLQTSAKGPKCIYHELLFKFPYIL